MQHSTRFTSILALLCLVGITLTASGCFHQQVVTGKEAGSTVIENKWATSLIAGLVPPPVVETAQQCPNGVARVETKISFLNGLVGGLTFNLYTPMTVKVTCAAGGMSSLDDESSVTVQRDATDEEVETAIRSAMTTSAGSSQAVTLRFE
jgi:hypothetical protein